MYSHVIYSFMNCSSVGTSQSLQFFKNCSSMGCFHGLQSLRMDCSIMGPSWTVAEPCCQTLAKWSQYMSVLYTWEWWGELFMTHDSKQKQNPREHRLICLLTSSLVWRWRTELLEHQRISGLTSCHTGNFAGLLLGSIISSRETYWEAKWTDPCQRKQSLLCPWKLSGCTHHAAAGKAEQELVQAEYHSNI